MKYTATHGLSKSYIWHTWYAMIDRCYNSKCKAFSDYGNKGITVCEFLRVSPTNLLNLIGHRPDGYWLDRIDNTRGYFCGACADCLSNSNSLNVRWATISQQMRNRSNNRWVAINGITKCAADWADELGINRRTFTARLGRGEISGAVDLKNHAT